MNPFSKYFLVGVVFWTVVDYTTAFNPDIQRWISYMPEIWLFYTGYPLLFAHLIYHKGWDSRRIFYAMLIAAFFIEVIFSHNALLYTFPIMLIMIPIAICIYGIVTFPPKWIISHELPENRKMLGLFTVVWIIVSLLNYVTNAANA